MSDIKPKLILRTGINISDKSPSPSTKLMLNHGKPNFTINRSKSKIDAQTPQPTTPEASQIVLKSTTFNGVIKPANLNLSTENEVNKVVLRPTKLPEANDKPQAQDSAEPEFMKVLRRTKQPETNGKPAQDDEPEFIKTQRKIAERLAKENNLDFEHRKSGYFTHVMMSPTSPNKPMELPVIENGKIQKAMVMDVSEAVAEPTVEEVKLVKNGQQEEAVTETEPAAQSEPDVTEVAKTLVEEVVQNVPEELTNGTENGSQNGVQNGVQNSAENAVENEVQNAVENGVKNGVQNVTENGVQEVQNVITNGDNQPKENGTVPAAVNFEPKTVVSFSKELSSEPNKYPDTVKVTQQVEAPTTDSALLQEMSKLKFDISADSEDVTVTPVLRAAE